MLLSLASIMMPMTLSAQESYTWDFESEEQFDQWISVDYDNDGFEWQYFSNEGLSSGLHTTHGGNGIAFSASYDNETQTALTPDNWLISPEVTLGIAQPSFGNHGGQYDVEAFINFKNIPNYATAHLLHPFCSAFRRHADSRVSHRFQSAGSQFRLDLNASLSRPGSYR